MKVDRYNECFVQPVLGLVKQLLEDLNQDATSELDQMGEIVVQLNHVIDGIAPKLEDTELKALRKCCHDLVLVSQFADRISQRVANTGKVTGIASNLAQLQFSSKEIDWVQAIAEIRASFTIADEHAVFDEVFSLEKLMDAIVDDDRKDVSCF